VREIAGLIELLIALCPNGFREDSNCQVYIRS
jgi:hypothetical protein